MIAGAGAALFLAAAGLAVASALGTVLSRRPLRAAMFLLTHLGSLALLYLTLHAELLAAVQLLVYAGAILVLFVFVIMLIGPSEEEPPPFRGAAPRTMAATGASLLTLALVGLVGRVVSPAPAAPEGFGGVDAVGHALFGEAYVPFELVAVTLTVAVLGVIGITRGRERGERSSEGAETE